MKKVLMFSLFAALCCSSGYLSAQTMMTKQTRFEGQNITGVAAGTAFQVEIYQSDKTSATVELPAKWAEKIEFHDRQQRRSDHQIGRSQTKLEKRGRTQSNGVSQEPIFFESQQCCIHYSQNADQNRNLEH